MNRPRVLRPEREHGLDLSSRASRLASGASRLDLARHDAARCSMLDEKSVSHDNRVQRSDNAYIIVDAFPYALSGEKRVYTRTLYTHCTPMHKDDGGI